MDTSKLTPAVFTIDGGGEDGFHVFGWHNPAHRWNGWACPVLPLSEASTLIEPLQSVIEESGYTEPGDEQALIDLIQAGNTPVIDFDTVGWCWEVAEIAEDRQFLLKPITTEAEAEAFIIALEVAGLSWHFDDAPEHLTDAEAAAARARVDELFAVLPNPFGLAVVICGRTSDEATPVYRMTSSLCPGEVWYGDVDRLTDEVPNADFTTERPRIDAMAVGDTLLVPTQAGPALPMTRLL